MCRLCRFVLYRYTHAMVVCCNHPPSSTLGISSNVTLPNPSFHCYPSPRPLLLQRPQCVMFPSLCPCVLIVQHPLMSENTWCLVFCSYVSFLRMMVSIFIHVSANDMDSFVFMPHSIAWCIRATFSLSSLFLTDIWVGSKSLLL